MYKIGIDILEYKSTKLNKKIINRVLTQRELLQYGEFKNSQTKRDFFFGRWCAKEAIFKALNNNLHPNKIEILNDKSGKPYSKVENFYIDISISHSKNYAVAVAIARKKK